MKNAFGVVFGLVGLLAVCGIIAWLWGHGAHPADTVRVAKKAEAQAAQIAGVTPEGVRAEDSVKLTPFETGGKLRYLLVDDVMAGGPMEQFYGIKRNDCIIEAANQSLRGEDPELAKGFVIRGYQAKAPLKVIRDEQEVTLPLPAVKATKVRSVNQQLEDIAAPR